MLISEDDNLLLGGKSLSSRLFVGTGKYANDNILPEVVKASGAQVVTVAIRRVEKDNSGIIGHIPDNVILLPNTSGARNANEAVRVARLAKAAGCGNWIKIEVISDSRFLLPDGYETAKATEILAKEDFVVLPYINPDLYVARACQDAGAAAIMPLGAPIGTNRGLRTREMIQILIDTMELPIIVDAGIGRPSQACEAMEMGAAACLVNTAIASSDKPLLMAEAFGKAVMAGRMSFLAGAGQVGNLARGASASSPLTGFLD